MIFVSLISLVRSGFSWLEDGLICITMQLRCIHFRIQAIHLKLAIGELSQQTLCGTQQIVTLSNNVKQEQEQTQKQDSVLFFCV